MIQVLDNRRVQDGFKELLVTCDIGRFNLYAFKSLTKTWALNRRCAQSLMRSRVRLTMLGLWQVFSRRSRCRNQNALTLIR